MVPMMFWAIGVDTSFENFAWVFGLATASGFAFCAQGFFWGMLIENEEQCQNLNAFVVMVFLCTNGCMINITSGNFIV